MNGWTRFSRADMQAKMTALVQALGLEHRVEGDTLWTHDQDYSIVESLRDAVREWAVGPYHIFRGNGGKDPSVYERYREYMTEHDIPCIEEDGSEGRWFILRKDDDAYEWGVEEWADPEAETAGVESNWLAGAFMKISRLIPMLPVKSMPASVEFYKKLGFSVETRNDDWHWAMLCCGDCRLMVDQSINTHPGLSRPSVIYLYPEDIVEYHKQVRENGLDVPDLEVAFYGMTEFRIDDPDGNRLWIGQQSN